jgi:hypothetical protein
MRSAIDSPGASPLASARSGLAAGSVYERMQVAFELVS